MPVTSDKRFREEQGLEDGLLRRLGGGLKQRVHPPVRRVQERHRLVRGEGQMLRGGKRNRHVAAAVPVDGARPRQSVPGPARQPPELEHVQRGVRRQKHDDAALLRGGGQRGGFRVHAVQPFPQQRAHRRPRQQTVLRLAEIGKHQRPDRERRPAAVRHPRGRTDAAFQVKAGHAPPRAHAPLRELAGSGGAGRAVVLRVHGEGLNVVEISVVAFEHQRIDRGPLAAHLGMRGDGGAYLRRGDRAHGEGVGQRERGFETAQLVQLHQADALAEPVEDAACGQRLLEQRIVVGDHDRHAGVDVSPV